MLAKHARRWPFALLLLAVSIAGAWFGEDLSQSLPSLFALVSSVVVTIAISIATPSSPARRVGAGCAAFALFWFGWAMGQSVAGDAYNEAVHRGEWLRAELADYYARTGGYPETLDELGAEIPGRRFLRGSVWNYVRTSGGYHLSVSDWLVAHHATHEHEFHAAK